jgi:hypothetical protein
MAKNDVYVANTTFSTDLDGAAVTIHKGRTRVAEGHPLYQSVPSLFDRVDAEVHFGVETTDAVPGELRQMPDALAKVQDPPASHPAVKPATKHAAKSK